MAALVKTAVFRGVSSTIPWKYEFARPNALLVLTRKLSDEARNYENFDIIITGGGMVGSTLACAIANNRKLERKSVLLLEGGRKQEYVPSETYSNRVVALNKRTHMLLSSIGAWKHIKDVRYGVVKKMQVWDACSDAIITFNEQLLSDELAYIVENDLLLHAVKKQLTEKDNVKVVYDSRVTNIKLPANQWDDAEVELQNGQKYKSKLLIGADGSNSSVRKAMGVQYLSWNYEQMGIVATLQLSEPTENIVAWQRFLPIGSIALLPLTDCLSSLVWSITTEKVKELLKVSEEEFVDSVNDALWKVYKKDGVVESGMRALQQLLAELSLDAGVVRQLQPSVKSVIPGSRAAFPLGFGHSVSYVQPGVALVGDAAHRVHPLAGQGVNLGFGDVAVLVLILAEAAANGAPLGDKTYLSEYETLRQRHNVPTMLTIDALHRLYKGTATPIVLARSIGLQLANAIPAIKTAMMQHAADQSKNR